MLRILKNHRLRVAPGIAAVMLALAVACTGNDIEGTPTLRPTRISDATPTPLLSEVARRRVTDVFRAQVAAIQQGDWAAVYQTCSPEFRAARPQVRFVRDATEQFMREGYAPAGFEARNIEPTLRAPDRIRVRWDAYQDGDFVRTVEAGQTYVFTQGDWHDDGAWCR